MTRIGNFIDEISKWEGTSGRVPIDNRTVIIYDSKGEITSGYYTAIDDQWHIKYDRVDHIDIVKWRYLNGE